jgi:predicted Ser/Thr protein kinase
MDQTSIGRYRVVRQLGRGGMGTLFLARDPMIDRLIAIKLLRTDLDSDDVRERFEREARFAGGLRHPNIVTIFDVGDEGGHPFIAMEYIDGETLLDVIRDRRPVSFGRRLEWIEELCAGLDYAHRAGVVHRDIKPANLMINTEGTLKILDFGVARLGESEMTRTGMVIGTLNYMAPEQMESRPIDARADIFSVGAVFYELLAYQRAFPGDVARVVMHKILSGSVEPLATVCPSLDPEISSIVNRCLEKDAAKRWPDLDEVRQRVATVRLRLANDPRAADMAEAKRSVETPPAGVTPASAGVRRATERQHLLQIRADQIQKHLRHAREAFDQRDYAAVVNACREAMVLDPDEPDAMALAERAQAAAERQQVDAWLEEARTEFARGGLTAAAVLADRALVFDQTLPEAQAIKRAVHDARRRLAEEGERLRAGAESVAPAERQLAAGPQIQSVQPRREETRFWFQPAMARRLGYLAWALAGVLVLAGGVAITRWWNVPPQTQRDAGKSPLPPVASVAPQPPAVVESGSTTSAPEGAVGGDATAPPRATKAAAGPSAARAGSPAPVSGTRGAPVIEAPAANSRQALQVACDRGDAARCYDLGVSYQTAMSRPGRRVRQRLRRATRRAACRHALSTGVRRGLRQRLRQCGVGPPPGPVGRERRDAGGGAVAARLRPR